MCPFHGYHTFPSITQKFRVVLITIEDFIVEHSAMNSVIFYQNNLAVLSYIFR